MTPEETWRRQACLFALLALSLAAPPDLSARVRCDIADAADSSYRYSYSYAVTNTSTTLAIAAVRIDGSLRLGLPLPGWTHTLSVMSDGHAWRAVGIASAIKPGAPLTGPTFFSDDLPGVGRITIYPAVIPANWDDPSPEGREQAVIGPTIAAGQGESIAQTTDMLRGVRAQLIAALIADGDGSAQSLDRLLSEAVAALERRDLNVAEAALRDARALAWQTASAWRADLHRALDIDLAYLLTAIARSGALVESQPGPVVSSHPTTREIWIFPGMTPPPEADLDALIDHTALGVIGMVDSVSVESGDVRTDLRTRVRLRPSEILWGEAPGDPIDVWMRGATYFRAPDLDVPLSPRPADAVAGCHPGDIVFAAPHRFATSGLGRSGQLWIAAPETFVFFNGGHVYPGPTFSRAWVEAVLKQGPAAALPADSSADEATNFRTALRQAALQHFRAKRPAGL